MEIVNLIISILSLIATIAISFVIYFLERKNLHNQRIKEIKDEAKKFIIKNADEIDYLHWATIAAGCFPQNKHTRNIYNEFSLLDEETELEVLKQRDLKCELITDDNWIQSKISLIGEAVKELDLGKDFLYDGGKYFTSAYKYKKNSIAELSNLPYTKYDYDDVFGLERIFFARKGKSNYFFYLNDYLYCKFENINPKEDKKEIIKPNDYLIMVEDLKNCSEGYLCFWIMTMISNVIIYAIKYLNWKKIEHTETDAQAETYEDKYFSILYELYYLKKE